MTNHSIHSMTEVARMPVAGMLAWLVPGLGHIYLGHRGRGVVCLVTITATFWTGVAIGGVRDTVDPAERKLWFIAQLCTVGNAAVGYALHRSIARHNPQDGEDAISARWASIDVGVHYTGVAGLLNLLVIFDAIGRAEPSAGTKGKQPERQRGVP